MASREPVFNPRMRSLRRTRISAAESFVSLIILLFLTAVAFWVASKRDDFDPRERDVATATLEQNTVADTLYRSPVQRWSDPAQPQSAAAPDLGIFPSAILDGGWQTASRLQRFDSDTLYEKINGAAEQYFQFGFKELHYLVLGKPGADLEISLELYDMGLFQNALGVFAAQRDEGKAIERSGKAYYYPTLAGAIGITGGIYFRFTANQTEAIIQEKALQLVSVMSGLDTGSEAAPQPFLILSEKLAIPFDDIAYERTDVFQYAFAKDFWFGKPKKNSDLRYYLHEAANPEDAAVLFDKLLENNLYDYTVVSRADSDVVFKHKFLETYSTLNRRQNLVFGIDNAPDQAALDAALPLLSGALDVDEEM